MLLRQHRVNKRGRCEYCGWTRWTWRFWRRRPQCMVYLSLDFAVRQPLDAVWRRLLEDRKTRAKLDDVPEELAKGNGVGLN